MLFRSTSVIGEDMEIVLRMRKYMAEQDKKYTVIYIPDPLCWTEVPEDLKTLKSQRKIGRASCRERV